MEMLFFDVGYTLIDESRCIRQRISDTVAGTEVTEAALQNAMEYYARQNQDPYGSAAIEFYDLPKRPWRQDLERLYGGVPELLQELSKHYLLGIIANQSENLEKRLEDFGIRDYFSVILGSGDVGVKKPDSEIFQLALKEADCRPEQAWMIGDRLDLDILPAMDLGMHTVWVRQGLGRHGNPALLPRQPEYTIKSILELSMIFTGGSPM